MPLESQNFTATRMTYTTSSAYETVLSKIDSSIGTSRPSEKIPQLVAQSTEEFKTGIQSLLGPHDFMVFDWYDHGAWVSKHYHDDITVTADGPGNLTRSKRIIFGNPLIAITMLKHDYRAGLFVPVEALFTELQHGKGTRVMWNLPSSLIAPDELSGDEKLREAARILDGKLNRLIEWACEE